MQRPSLKTWIIGLLIVATTQLAGCGAIRLAYGQGPELGYWWADGYVDFDDAQTPRARQAMADWFAWHRSTQLPDYAQYLVRAQAHVTEPITAAQVCRLYQEAWERLDPLIDRALPPATELAQMLTLEQVKHMERKYDKMNKEFRSDFLQPDPQDRLKKSVARAVKRAETLYGDLDDAQEEALAKGVSASPFDPQLWLEERQLRQQDALKTLRALIQERASAAQTQAALRRLVKNVQRSPREAYLGYQQRLLQYNCGLAAQLHNSTTRAQRDAALKKLKGWEEDARVLHAAQARSKAVE